MCAGLAGIFVTRQTAIRPAATASRTARQAAPARKTARRRKRRAAVACSALRFCSVSASFWAALARAGAGPRAPRPRAAPVLATPPERRVPMLQSLLIGQMPIRSLAPGVRRDTARQRPAQAFPFAGGIGEMAMHSQPLPVLHEPLVQALPFADQRFMRHLGAVLVQGDQARLSQRVEHAAQLGRFLRLMPSSVKAARRRVSSVPSPNSVRRKKISRASSCCARSSWSVKTLSAVSAMALRTPPAA